MRPGTYIAFIVSLVLLIISIQKCHNAHDTSWSDKNQQLFKDHLYEVASNADLSEEQQKIYADCGLEKAKEMMPYGFGNISDDSMRNIAIGISKTCLNEVHRYSGWTATDEKMFYKIIYEQAAQNLSEAQKKAYADCSLQKAKDQYPQGLPNVITDSVKFAFVKIGTTCLEEILPKKKFWDENESLIRYTLLNSKGLKSLNNTDKNFMCGCLIDTLKKIYPNGDLKGASKIAKKINEHCLLKLITRKTK